MSEAFRGIYLTLAGLGALQCLTLLAFILTIREVRKEVHLLQSLRRTWRLSLDAFVQATLDRQRRTHREASVVWTEPVPDEAEAAAEGAAALFRQSPPAVR
jgi:hypothetical protein